MFTVIIVVCSLKSILIPTFILIDCCVSELQCRICPYCNIWPEAVYSCFTRTTLFTCFYDQSYWLHNFTKFRYATPGF